MFKRSKIGYPVKEMVENIKNNPDKYRLEIDGKNNRTVRVINSDSPKYSFYIFPTSNPLLASLFRSPMWYVADSMEWMNDKEKSYLYSELSKTKPTLDERLREQWAKAYNVNKKESKCIK